MPKGKGSLTDGLKGGKFATGGRKGGNANQGITKKAYNTRVGARGGYKGVRYGDAAKQVNAEIRGAVQDVRRDKKKAARQANSAIQKTDALYQNSLTDLDKIYDETGGFIAEQNNQMAANSEAARAQVTAAQSALASALATNGQQGADTINNELSRLGLSGGYDMAQFAGDQTRAQNMGAQINAGQTGLLASQSQNASAVGTLLAGMNAGQRGAAMGNALLTRNSAVTDLTQKKMDAFQSANEAITQARGQRGDLTRDLLKQLAETGWSQYVQAAQLRMQQQAAAAARASSGGSSSSSSSGSSTGSSSGTAGSLSRYSGSSKTKSTTTAPKGGYTSKTNALERITRGMP